MSTIDDVRRILASADEIRRALAQMETLQARLLTYSSNEDWVLTRRMSEAAVPRVVMVEFRIALAEKIKSHRKLLADVESQVTVVP